MEAVVTVLGSLFLIWMITLGLFFNLLGLSGNFVILMGAGLYGWGEDFQRVSGGVLAILGVMWLVGEILESVAGIRGARKEKASWLTVFAAFAGALAGGIIGTGIVPLVGTVCGTLAGGYLVSYGVEHWKTKDKEQAMRAASGVVKGQLMGLVVKLTMGMGMTGVIIYKVWVNG